MTKRWITETLHDDIGFRVSFEAERVIEETRTAQQHLVLFENRFFGRVLMLDGAVQLTSRDEFIYHEMMTHVPLFAHGRARKVLVIGGGDCGIAREVLRHPGVERLTQVEIDPSVVEFARAYLPELAEPVIADPRFELVIGDGAAYVTQASRRFDVIIVDSTDPVGPGAVLFTRDFYAACRNALADGGVLVTQNGAPFLQADELVASLAHFRSLFADAACYLATVPTYVGGPLAIGWASDDASLRTVDADILSERHRAAGGFETRYWTPQVQYAAFALPRYIADMIGPAPAA